MGNDPFAPNPYFSPVNGLSGGYPANVFTLDVPPAFRGITQNFRNPIVHKWNVAAQQDLGHNMAFEASYVGNHQAHSVRIWDPNDCPNSPLANYNCDANRPVSGARRPLVCGRLRLRQLPWDDGQVGEALLRRVQLPVQLHLWARARKRRHYPDGFSNQNTKIRRNLALGYSSAAWDIRHSSVTSFIYDLPFGKGRAHLTSGVGSYVLGGWQMNGILRSVPVLRLRSGLRSASEHSERVSPMFFRAKTRRMRLKAGVDRSSGLTRAPSPHRRQEPPATWDSNRTIGLASTRWISRCSRTSHSQSASSCSSVLRLSTSATHRNGASREPPRATPTSASSPALSPIRSVTCSSRCGSCSKAHLPPSKSPALMGRAFFVRMG